MKVVGVFRELERNCNVELPSIIDAMGKLDISILSEVVDYLNEGVPIFDIMEYVRDPIEVGSGVSGGSSLLTDGEWVWRADLGYYVEKYAVELPQNFLSYISENDDQVLDSKAILSKWKICLSTYNSFVGR